MKGKPSTRDSKIIKNKKNGFLYYQFPHLSALKKDIWHGILSGQIRKKTNQLIRLNISRPRRSIRKIINISPIKKARVVMINQIHGSKIVMATADNYQNLKNISADAVVTAEPGFLLTIKTADCQPIIMYDPVKKVATAIHCGWRGNRLNIIKKTINFLKKKYKINPANILVGIGPSLGRCCSEFINRDSEFSKEYRKYFLPDSKVDLWQLSCDQLSAAGVKKKNIVVSGICTKCNPDWFSYRREKSRAGRFASVIGLMNNA